jgi:hypothetical protein
VGRKIGTPLFQLVVTESTQNLRRLEAQRNELNAKGKWQKRAGGARGAMVRASDRIKRLGICNDNECIDDDASA